MEEEGRKGKNEGEGEGGGVWGERRWVGRGSE